MLCIKKKITFCHNILISILTCYNESCIDLFIKYCSLDELLSEIS